MLEYTFDSLGRKYSTVYSKITLNNAPYTATFSYKDSTVGANATTPLVNAITYPDHSYGYTYKANGDIEAVTYIYGTTAYTSFYHYDDLRRLVREDNGYSYRTYTYEYDASGNILNRKEYSYTAPETAVGTPTSTYTYTYGDSTWKDLLTSYNGESMVYDAVGNPTTYRGKAFTWDNNIRKPVTMQTDGGSLEFAYDAAGARREKAATFIGADVSHFYHYDGGILLYEVISTQTPLDETPTVEIIEYIYDETGSPVGMIYDGTEYYFVKNLQGDVQRIYKADGTLVGEYHYDAWGNILNESSLTEIEQINPFRYRSYYYDSESGLYYLNSRYYDAETGRFINADAYVSTGQGMSGYNMFAYCLDNPVMLCDPSGNAAVGHYLMRSDRIKQAVEAVIKAKTVNNSNTEEPYAVLQNQDSPVVSSTIDKNSPPDHPNYTPPKKHKGGKVKNPNGPGWGWPAEDRGVWMPDPDMHGGEGWTIQYPGGGHSHAYPGGGVRNHFELEQSTGRSITMILGGAVTTVYLLANDFTGVGVADDPWLAGSMACFVAGVDGLFGKKVCTVCGEVKYGY